VALFSEHKHRSIAHSLIDDNVPAGMSAFTSTVNDDSEHIKEVPSVYAPS